MVGSGRPCQHGRESQICRLPTFRDLIRVSRWNSSLCDAKEEDQRRNSPKATAGQIPGKHMGREAVAIL